MLENPVFSRVVLQKPGFYISLFDRVLAGGFLRSPWQRHALPLPDRFEGKIGCIARRNRVFTSERTWLIIYQIGMRSCTLCWRNPVSLFIGQKVLNKVLVLVSLRNDEMPVFSA